MKLRITGQSLRFRLSRSDVANFIDTGGIEETIYLGAHEKATFSYALLHGASAKALVIEYQERKIAVIVATNIAKRWAEEEVGIEGSVETSHGPLEILIEKDFACLHGEDRDNTDTFPNPLETDTAAVDQ